MADEKDILLTGDRPTGRLHLGHFVGSIKSRLEFQEGSGFNARYYMIADVQALTDNADNPEKVRSNVLEVALDNLACGMDPERTTFLIQSQVPAIAELTVFFLNLVTVSRLKQNPTVKTEITQKGYGDAVPAGFLMYPISQAADILSFRANVVPAGEDQLPMIEQTNEVVEKFNRLYGETFRKVRAVVPKHGRLVGLDGGAKMSKSLGNAIYLSDEPKTIDEKVMQMYTDPGHIHAKDPGRAEGNVVFTYLDVFDPNTEEVAELKEHYRKGGLGDVVIKKRLATILNEVLDPIRTRRAALAKDENTVREILRVGTQKARADAERTLEDVKRQMTIDYFA